MEGIRDLADAIRKRRAGLNQHAQSLRGQLVLDVATARINASVSAIDGGLLSSRMHGVDIVLSRAAGVNFIYKDSALGSYSYHPGKIPQPKTDIADGLDDHEARVFPSLIRLKSELGCAIETAERFPADLMLLDGSLLPVPSDIPQKGSSIRPLYEEVVCLYSKLHDSCKGRLLCGIIKDSRSRKLAKGQGLDCSDSVFCSYLLESGKRTKTMDYFDGEPANHELESLGLRIKVFYLRSSENDLPLRVEVLGNESEAESAASLLCSLCSISSNFAYPAILIEADMCAALHPSEIEPIENELFRHAGIMPLRRNSRPFR